MRRKGLVISFFLLASMVVPQVCRAQRPPNWRTFKLADGLPESACLSITVSRQGKVLVRHRVSASLTELDGYSVRLVSAPEKPMGRIYQSPGGQLWAVSPEGLEEAREEAWVFHPVPEIGIFLRAANPLAADAVPLFPIKQGATLFLLPDRLMQFSSDQSPKTEVVREAAQAGIGKFTGMTAAADGGIWLCGSEGIAKIVNPRSARAETEWQKHLFPSEWEISNCREPHADGGGYVVLVAESTTNNQPLAVVFDGAGWKLFSAGNEKLLHAWRGPDNIFWAITRDTLLQWESGADQPLDNDDISARQYFDAAVEPGGAFWLATSDGLYRYAPLTWRRPPALRSLKSLVTGLVSDREGAVWFLAGGALHRLDRDQHVEFGFPAALARTLTMANGLFTAKDGSIVIDAAGRLFGFRAAKGFYEVTPREKPGDAFRIIGTLPGDNLYVERLSKDSQELAELSVYDGARFEKLPDPPLATSTGTRLLAIFTANNGDTWVSGDRGTALLHEKKWRAFLSADGSTPAEAIQFAELPDGKILCATADSVWEFDGKNWMTIRRGFDGITSLARTRDGSIWLGSNNGLHRFVQGDWVELGLEEGLASASIRALCEDQNGRFWAASSHGLNFYAPEADLDPPHAVLEPVSDEDKNLPEGQGLNISFIGTDKWKFTARQRLLYSYRLDQKEWSPFQEAARASLVDLPAGKHYFQVRTMDRNCNIDPKPPQFEFAVVLPWYREKRLVLISGAGLVAVIFFAWLAFNRHLRLLRGYAEIEKNIALRTQELEMANRELLHSQKMNALGTLAAGIAHDFNNILSIIKGSAQIIEENLEDTPKVRTRVDRIKTVVEQGAGIVKAMLGFSRESDGPSPLCNLNAAVQDTLKLLGDRFLREIRVTFDGADGVPEVRCSKDFIQQILLNFIFNAADAMSEHKQIRIVTAQSPTLPTGMALMPVQANGYATVSVEDSGCGIPGENLPRIFEPFFTTKAFSSRRGTGLGLSMVYELAKKMDAGLAVESTVGRGSKFTLILPLVRIENPVKPEALAQEPAFPARN